MMGRMPAASAALWNRGAPYTPSRSTSASAEYPRSAARSMSASGSEAPWRKLKADAAWSSMYGGKSATTEGTERNGRHDDQYNCRALDVLVRDPCPPWWML